MAGSDDVVMIAEVTRRQQFADQLEQGATTYPGMIVALR
jgi:hypothetical protein